MISLRLGRAATMIATQCLLLLALVTSHVEWSRFGHRHLTEAGAISHSHGHLGRHGHQLEAGGGSGPVEDPEKAEDRGQILLLGAGHAPHRHPHEHDTAAPHSHPDPATADPAADAPATDAPATDDPARATSPAAGAAGEGGDASFDSSSPAESLRSAEQTPKNGPDLPPAEGPPAKKPPPQEPTPTDTSGYLPSSLTWIDDQRELIPVGQLDAPRARATLPAPAPFPRTFRFERQLSRGPPPPSTAPA